MSGCPQLPIQLCAAARPALLLRVAHRQREVGLGARGAGDQTTLHWPRRYYIKADIVRDWKWDHKVEQHITVSGILDLNHHPEAKHQGIQYLDTGQQRSVFLSCVQGSVGTTRVCAASAASLGPSLQQSTQIRG